MVATGLAELLPSKVAKPPMISSDGQVMKPDKLKGSLKTVKKYLA